jgi:hypothetical protein
MFHAADRISIPDGYSFISHILRVATHSRRTTTSENLDYHLVDESILRTRATVFDRYVTTY